MLYKKFQFKKKEKKKKCCSFELHIYERIPKENESWFPQKYWADQLFSTLIIIQNVSWATNKQIKKITEWSCDTENSHNDLHHTFSPQ